MTDHLPYTYTYTYTDPDTGYTLSVSSTHLRIIDDDRVYDEMPAPTGEDAVALARAVLAAAGNTGHLVVSVEDSSRAIRIREALAAEDMRHRYSQAISDLLELHGASDALINDAWRLDCLPLTRAVDTDDANPMW